ncbi:MAG: transposase [Planctomycetota bacterium]|nr:transposase [Planctomycetota bacterium]
MVAQRSFKELNLWQRIFAEHWESFVVKYEHEQRQPIPEHWQQNVERMLSCGDIREGYYEYFCQDCGETKKIGFSCKSRLCLRCFKVAVDDWLNTARKVLFEGVIHRQVVLTVPTVIRPLILADEEFLKVYMDAGAKAVKELVEEWRRKKKIRVGIMAVLQVHGRAGNANPHLHFVVSEGGIDKDNKWREVNFFDTKKLRKKWQYHVITALRKAVKGTEYVEEWHNKLGSMFKQYPSGFDCDCMPEEGPVERLIVYLVKYVSSPPISMRRIEKYDGQNVTYRYKDHRKGEVHETIPATEFIGRMIQHLPPKNFRMVRYYGIYARPVREKIHALVAGALKALVRRAEQVAEYFARKRGISPAEYRAKLDEKFGKRQMRCEKCGSTKMLLIRIWSKEAGMIYEIGKDDPRVRKKNESVAEGRKKELFAVRYEQLAFVF